MFHQILTLLQSEQSLLWRLLQEYIQISSYAIVIFVVLGGFIGVFLSKNQKFSSITLAVINFHYTIPTISPRFFNSTDWHRGYYCYSCPCYLCSSPKGKKHLHRTHTSRPCSNGGWNWYG